MKKIIIVLLVLTMGFAVIGTGCSDKKDDNSSSSTSYSSSTVSNSDSSSSDLSSDSNLDSDFKWEDGKYIVGLSDQGKKKKNITVPEGSFMLITDSEAASSVSSSDENNGFNSNDLLESISFESDTITSLPGFMFQDDTNLREVKLPKNLKKIDTCTFAGCTSLKTVEIPSTVTKIKELAFTDSGIEELTLPEGVEEVEGPLFNGTKLKKIYLPASLKEIHGWFLTDIDNLDSKMNPVYKVEVYVKKGSYADKHYDDYGESSFIKKYY